MFTYNNTGVSINHSPCWVFCFGFFINRILMINDRDSMCLAPTHYFWYKVTPGNFDRWGTLTPFSFPHGQFKCYMFFKLFWLVTVCATIWGVDRYVSYMISQVTLEQYDCLTYMCLLQIVVIYHPKTWQVGYLDTFLVLHRFLIIVQPNII